jgi:hypothetical protein
MPDLEQTFFQGLHENIKLKIIDNLNAGAPANLGQNLRRYNDIVRKAIEAEEEQKRVARQIQQMTRNINPGRPNTRSQDRQTGGPRVFLAKHTKGEPEADHERNTAPTDTTWANAPTSTRFALPRSFCARYTGNTIAEDMISASVEMVNLLEDEEPDGFAGVSIVEQVLRNASGVRRPIKCFGCARGWTNMTRIRTICGKTARTKPTKTCGETFKLSAPFQSGKG